MPASKRAYLALGSNLGDREKHLEDALALLVERGISVLKKSSVYETAPQGFTDQGWFLNMVVAAECRLFPVHLLAALQSIERQLGRNREAGPRFGPRVIDLDVLLYGTSIINSANLVVPHPRMWERRFVVEPLVEIAPEVRDPVTGRSGRDFLRNLETQPVKRRALQSSSDHR